MSWIEPSRSGPGIHNDHYLLLFRCSPDRWDPKRPMSDSGIRKPWEAVRRVAGVPWLRRHDLRHTAITRMAEAGVPIPVIMGIAGHVSAQRYTHYTSVSMAAKWLAVQATSLSASNSVGSLGPPKTRARQEEARSRAMSSVKLATRLHPRNNMQAGTK